MTPRTPTLTSAIQHLLVAAMGITYLIAAAAQIHRDNHTTAAINLLIALALTLILQAGVADHGRILSNYVTRRQEKRLKREQDCAWCGEGIETGQPATRHAGVINGDKFSLYHHPECDDAIHDWYEANANTATRDLPYPRPGSMQRGQPTERSADPQ